MALSAVSCVITIVAQRPAEKSVIAVPFDARLVNAIFSYGMYLWKAVFPLRLGSFTHQIQRYNPVKFRLPGILIPQISLVYVVRLWI